MIAPFKVLQSVLLQMLSSWMPEFVNQWVAQQKGDPFLSLEIGNLELPGTTLVHDKFVIDMNSTDTSPWTNISWQYISNMEAWYCTINWDDTFTCTQHNMQTILHVPIALFQCVVCCNKYICCFRNYLFRTKMSMINWWNTVLLYNWVMILNQ